MTEDFTGKEINALLVRNPWGITGYNGDYNAFDIRWSQSMVNQVPYGIDPRLSDREGIFVLPVSYLRGWEIDCLNQFWVGHYRDKEGYSDNWYDALNMDN